MKNTKDFYNQTAIKWAYNWYKDDSLLPYLKEFFKYLPKNPRILDLCCGAGYESMRMQKLGANVTGLDFSEESIRIAKEKNPNIKFVIDNILNDYSYLGKFDGCAIIAGLVHIPKENLSQAFNQINKILSNDGFLFIVVKDGVGKDLKSSYKTISGEDYDRNFYMHTLQELKLYSSKNFTFIKKISFNKDITDLWKYYIFKKISE